MKLVFLLLVSFFPFQSYGQFDPSKEWFTLHDFFESSVIKENQVRTISVFTSNKKDEAIFSSEVKLAEYSFSKEGKLTRSEYYVALSNRTDTASFKFEYSGNKVYKRTENQGPFSFSYGYNWLNDSCYQETKLDNKTKDTNYIHSTKVIQTGRKKKLTYFNSIGRPMKNEWVTQNLFGKVVYKRTSYARSLSFIEEVFDYRATQIVDRYIWNTIGKQKKTDWEFTYKEGYLDFITVKENDSLIFKYGLLYNDQNLLKALVKRDVVNKSVRVYKIEYRFYLD
ncbi:MAG: hypothetical protein QMC40_03425 [Vicingaceae bacterium]|jgi:hypothetical protein|tara:strand:- start:168 stop:1010 length:843 start_codon:yes stop_codon:yes gene_type:complete